MRIGISVNRIKGLAVKGCIHVFKNDGAVGGGCPTLEDLGAVCACGLFNGEGTAYVFGDGLCGAVGEGAAVCIVGDRWLTLVMVI